MPHAVSRLRAACLTDRPTRPRLDRAGLRADRCERCRLVASHCLCALRPVVPTHAALCLLMAEFEPLKPSNTGWLVADVVPDTSAFGWSRLHADAALLARLADPQWQPVVVFPGEFAAPERVVSQVASDPARPGARPLFVLLDGTWSEARKMFRKSPYLDALPVLSLGGPNPLTRYQLRRSSHDHHFCTAEVAARCLDLAGDHHAAQTLEAYLALYSHRYLRARQSVPHDPLDASQQRLQALSRAMPDASATPDAPVSQPAPRP
ncbi:MAG: tRNA-uridine aminocarboxypropyltransferase [Leptothrix sp. (in: b-proteobacteria)]